MPKESSKRIWQPRRVERRVNMKVCQKNPEKSQRNPQKYPKDPKKESRILTRIQGFLAVLPTQNLKPT